MLLEALVPTTPLHYTVSYPRGPQLIYFEE
jgi:hypothetical protein